VTHLREISVTPPTLAEAQAFVGGYVELFWLDRDRQVLVNEDGLSMGLEFNQPASEICGRPLVGNVMILVGKARWT
jgi:hypothetical protein